MSLLTERWLATRRRLDADLESETGSFLFIIGTLVIVVALTIVVNLALGWIWPPLIAVFWLWVAWRVVKYLLQHLAATGSKTP